MIRAFIQAVDIQGLSTLESEFQKMDDYNRDHPQGGIMLVQLRRVVAGKKYSSEFHIAGRFIETEMANKIIELVRGE
jgi:hypothetical protein